MQAFKILCTLYMQNISYAKLCAKLSSPVADDRMSSMTLSYVLVFVSLIGNKCFLELLHNYHDVRLSDCVYAKNIN